MIQKTTDYSIFKLRPDNRPLAKSHLSNLMTSIQNNNLLSVRPIWVNSEMEVIDGQHRLEVAKALGIEVYYEVVENFTIDDLLTINVNKSWTSQDYLNYYCHHEYEDYLKLNEFLKKTDVNLSFAIDLNGKGLLGRYADFRKGLYIFKLDKDEQLMLHYLESISILEKDHGKKSFFKSTKFARAMFAIFRNPYFSAEKWLSNLKFLSDRVIPRATTAQYKKHFLKIYNWRNRNPLITDFEEGEEKYE